MNLHNIYSIINTNYPPELYPSAEPYRLEKWKIKEMLNIFIDKVNGIFKAQRIEVVIVALDRIKVDNRFQSRVEINKETVTRYKDSFINGAMFPPVDIGIIDGYREETITSDGYSLGGNSPSSSASYYLLDGFHRYYAKKKLPLWNQYILAVVHRGISEADAKMLSIINNRKQGLSYTRQDKAKILDIYMETKRYLDLDGHIKSFRHIARELQIISEPTIRRRITKYYPEIAEQIKAAYFGTTAYIEQEGEASETDEAETAAEIEAKEAEQSAKQAAKAFDKALSTLSQRVEDAADNAAALRYESALLALLNDSRKRWGRAEIERTEEYRDEEDF